MTIPDPRSYLGEPTVEIVVHARPAPQGSKRNVGGGRMVEQSKYVKPFREAITKEASKVVGANWVPLDGPLTASYVFTIKRPAKPMFDAPATPGDLEKYQRAVSDALNPKGAWKGVWADDSRVTHFTHTLKTYPSFTIPGALPSEGLTIWIWKGNN